MKSISIHSNHYWHSSCQVRFLSIFIRFHSRTNTAPIHSRFPSHKIFLLPVFLQLRIVNTRPKQEDILQKILYFQGYSLFLIKKFGLIHLKLIFLSVFLKTHPSLSLSTICDLPFTYFTISCISPFTL